MEFTQTDIEAIERAEHDVSALVADLPSITSDSAELAIVQAKADALKQACNQLRGAINERAKETRETKEARQALISALNEAVRLYVGIMQLSSPFVSEFQRELVEESEFVARQTLYNQVFSLSASEIKNVGRGSQIETLRLVADLLKSDDPIVKSLTADKPMDRFFKAVSEAQAANKVFDKETSEDIQATQKTKTARELLDRQVKVYNHTVRLICTQHGLEDRKSQYLSQYDSKAAGNRRKQGQSIEEDSAEAPNNEPSSE